MNEAEAAEKFNAELDALLGGAGRPGAASDPGALALAARFAALDLSAESAIKESLREKIGAPGLLAGLRALFANNYARAAFAAAALVLALLPLARRPAPERALPAGPAVTAQAPRPAPPPAAAAAPRAARPAPEAEGIFASLPMPELKPRPIKEFPISSAGRLNLAVVEGREVSLDGGSGVVWETEDGAYILERRPVAPGELFEVRTL